MTTQIRTSIGQAKDPIQYSYYHRRTVDRPHMKHTSARCTFGSWRFYCVSWCICVRNARADTGWIDERTRDAKNQKTEEIGRLPTTIKVVVGMKVVINFEAQQRFRAACPRFPPWCALPRPDRERETEIFGFPLQVQKFLLFCSVI
jgi:hypothetical protein